jgi:hypothetical protein
MVLNQLVVALVPKNFHPVETNAQVAGELIWARNSIQDLRLLNSEASKLLEVLIQNVQIMVGGDPNFVLEIELHSQNFVLIFWKLITELRNDALVWDGNELNFTLVVGKHDEHTVGSDTELLYFPVTRANIINICCES